MRTDIAQDIQRYIADQVQAGRYPDSRELMSELSRILTPQALMEFRAAWLRREIAKAGDDSDGIPAGQVFAALEADLKAKYPEFAGH